MGRNPDFLTSCHISIYHSLSDFFSDIFITVIIGETHSSDILINWQSQCVKPVSVTLEYHVTKIYIYCQKFTYNGL